MPETIRIKEIEGFNEACPHAIKLGFGNYFISHGITWDDLKKMSDLGIKIPEERAEELKEKFRLIITAKVDYIRFREKHDED